MPPEYSCARCGLISRSSACLRCEAEEMVKVKVGSMLYQVMREQYEKNVAAQRRRRARAAAAAKAVREDATPVAASRQPAMPTELEMSTTLRVSRPRAS